MTKPQKIEGGWEQKWDNNFPLEVIDISSDGGNVRETDETVKLFDTYKINLSKRQKAFISDLLASERQRCYELVGSVSNIAKKAYTQGSFDDGVHTAVTRARTLIANLDQAKHNLE